MKTCKIHGTFTAKRCSTCAVELVDSLRKKKKLFLLELLGNKCSVCGYDKCSRALQAHHIDPKTKEFNLSDKGRSYSFERIRLEAMKCILLCANCHMEVEAGMIDLT